MTFFLKKYADHVGIAASGLCLVHCLLMPFITAFWLQKDHCTVGGNCCDEATGFNYDYLFLAFSALAVWLASRHCNQRWIKALMWVCFALLAGGMVLAPFIEGTHGATLFAAVGLATAHFFNWRHCRQCNP
jgi:cyanate permease